MPVQAYCCNDATQALSRRAVNVREGSFKYSFVTTLETKVINLQAMPKLREVGYGQFLVVYTKLAGNPFALICPTQR